ncbi:SCA7-domain-containing protein [Rhizophagus irregularis DAOM 181602=DAOM 197198]|nr:SCA7-domain-containing protein [Rhizophagus irregularis DAOM 181602=DAOM 197198]
MHSYKKSRYIFYIERYVYILRDTILLQEISKIGRSIAPPDNTPCARSLNCKKHSLASKRNVADRSQLYVILLIQNQKNKKSIGRYQVSTKEDDNSLEK